MARRLGSACSRALLDFPKQALQEVSRNWSRITRWSTTETPLARPGHALPSTPSLAHTPRNALKHQGRANTTEAKECRGRAGSVPATCRLCGEHVPRGRGGGSRESNQHTSLAQGHANDVLPQERWACPRVVRRGPGDLVGPTRKLPGTPP